MTREHCGRENTSYSDKTSAACFLSLAGSTFRYTCNMEVGGFCEERVRPKWRQERIMEKNTKWRIYIQIYKYICRYVYIYAGCVCVRARMYVHAHTHSRMWHENMRTLWWQEGVHQGEEKREGERGNEQSSDANLSHVIMKVFILYINSTLI